MPVPVFPGRSGGISFAATCLGLSLLLSSVPGMAQPVRDEARAAVGAFLDNPGGAAGPIPPRPGQGEEIGLLAEAGKLRAFDAPEIVYLDETVAIAAVETRFPGLTQTLYVRLRREAGRWTVADWSSARSLRDRFRIIQILDKASEADWETLKPTLGEAFKGLDFAAAKSNLRLALGSDRTFLETLAPDMAALKSLCRAIAAAPADIGALPIDPFDDEAVAALNKRYSGDAALAKIVADARDLNAFEVSRETDGALVVLSGVRLGAAPSPLPVRRILLCTAPGANDPKGSRALSLLARVNNGAKAMGVRDLGDGFYVIQGTIR